VPVYALQIITFGEQDGPQDVKDALVLPASEGAVDAAVIAELLGQMVPLAACAHAKDDAVEGLAWVAALASCSCGRVVDGQHLLDQLPERVGDVPDRRQRLLRFNWRFHAAIIGA